MRRNSIWSSWRRLFASHRPQRPRSQRRRPILEALEDRCVPATTSPISLLYDFGTAKSPVASGATQVKLTSFSQTQGFGWASLSGLSATDRGTSNPLTRDFHQGGDGRFVVNLPDGTYNVTVTVGDARAKHAGMALWLEGVQVATNLSTAAGQFLSRTYQVEVTGGQLNLRIAAGGRNNSFALNALAILSAGSATPSGPTVNAGPDQIVDEGALVTFAGSATGSGSLSYQWSFGDGGTASGSLTPSHDYADNGTFTATMTVTDGNGQTSQDSMTVTVRNLAPTATLSNSGPVNLGSTGAVSFTSALDASSVDQAAGFRYSYDFNNDGTFELGDSTSSTATVLASYLSAAGTRVVRGRIKDKDGGFTDYTTTITINPANSLAAVFANSGAVNEGSTGTVSFSSVAGGSGGYLYSYDFNNDGVFEITNGTSASATVPASYLAEGPGSRVVHGRLRDSVGNFLDFTTTITINNVAPTVVLNNRSGTTGTAISFSAAVTDPSAADTAAGFTYLWNFGDGTATSTLANPTHTYTTAGTYTVTVQVKDKDNGQTTVSATAAVTAPAPVGQFIVTPYDKIPNFGANPTIVTVHSGAWSDVNTWSVGRLPQAGDVVSIDTNTIVTYDVVSDAAVNTVAIQAGGSLRFRTDVNTRLTVVNLLVLEGGELQIGTAASPVAPQFKAEVVFADVPIDTTKDPSQYGNGLIALGKVTMHGAIKDQTFVRLAAEALAGATTLSVATPVSGWQVGDRLVLPDTRQLNVAANQTGAGFSGRWELATISAISADGRTLTLSQPLLYNHQGSRSESGVLEFLPHVGDITRNVVLRSASNFGTRGHTFFTDRADIDIAYAQFAGLGRTRIDPLNSTTFDVSGNVTHLGTNQAGRYPVNFAHLMGPAGGRADGYQFSFVGNSVVCQMNPQPFRWGITINDSHFGLIQDNVLYNWAGAGIVGESGSESYNVIDHNFVVKILSDTNTVDAGWLRADRRGTSDLATEGVAFWFRGPNNYVRNNVASDATSYGYTYFEQYVGTFSPNGIVRIPAFPGADLAVSGQYQDIDVYATPLLQFQNNEAYGAMPTGMTVWWLGTEFHTPENAPPSVVKDLHVWHTHYQGFFGYEAANVVIDGFVGRGDFAQLGSNTSLYGIWWGDYFCYNLTIRNSDIQGFFVGFEPSNETGGGTQTIENSFLKNYYNIQVRPMSTSFYRSDLLAPRLTVIRDVLFATPNVPDVYLGPKYNILLDGSRTGTVNDIQLDQIMVYNYNRVAGDNFQVYYLEQAPNFVLPQSIWNSDGSTSLTGSPVAWLTNQQNWNIYHIAFAGAVSPTTATRASIKGFVWPT